MSVCLLKLGLGTAFDMIAAFVEFLMSLCVKEKVFLDLAVAKSLQSTRMVTDDDADDDDDDADV